MGRAPPSGAAFLAALWRVDEGVDDGVGVGADEGGGAVVAVGSGLLMVNAVTSFSGMLDKIRPINAASTSKEMWNFCTSVTPELMPLM
jgi:hypothetical protein